ncbi:MAG TPA: acyl carrier protein [Candidatus Binatia bacterium]|nr:acyl carrier protein [Candidatus Binatia bacterium]
MIPNPKPRVDLRSLERQVLTLLRERLLDLPPEFGPTDRLVEAGLDSMAVMQLLLLVEEKYGVWLPESDLLPENLESVRSFARLLARRLEERGGV